MPNEHEKLWDYDAVAIGQTGTETTVTITMDTLREYARATQHARGAELDQTNDATHPVENPVENLAEKSAEALAMPSMVLAYAPLLRYDLAENNGCVALEDSKTARRQTPFAKCDIRWHAPVVVGDYITATRRVLDKYERRGNKFVTFRVEAVNQRGLMVAEYDYTCIFAYAQGQKTVPASDGSEPGGTTVKPGQPVAESHRVLTAEHATIGSRLPALQVTESQDTLLGYNNVQLAGRLMTSNIHTDEEFARQNIFGGAVNAGPATLAYVEQMLTLSFPLSTFYSGGRLLMRAIEPFRAGHVVTLQGEVTAAQAMGNHHQVSCTVRGTNQLGSLVCLAEATLNLPSTAE